MMKFLFAALIFGLLQGCMHLPMQHDMHMSGHNNHDQQAICPVSNTTVIISKQTPSTVYQNRIYYFADEERKAVFLKNPEEFINKKDTSPRTSSISTSSVAIGIIGIVIMGVMMGVMIGF